MSSVALKGDAVILAIRRILLTGGCMLSYFPVFSEIKKSSGKFSSSGTPKNLLVLVTHRLELLLALMLGDLLATLFLEVAHFELSLFLYF